MWALNVIDYRICNNRERRSQFTVQVMRTLWEHISVFQFWLIFLCSGFFVFYVSVLLINLFLPFSLVFLSCQYDFSQLTSIGCTFGFFRLYFEHEDEKTGGLRINDNHLICLLITSRSIQKAIIINLYSKRFVIYIHMCTVHNFQGFYFH